MSVKQWIERTSGIGLRAKSGRYGSGTYAHKDIALKFASWISPELELLIILEFQRLKQEESKHLNQNWDLRRLLARANYKIQTDAVKDVLIPIKNLPKEMEGFVYAEEADLLYQAMYGYTAKQWKETNPELALSGGNMRDYASLHQLIVLNGLEVVNAELIRAGLSIEERFEILRKSAIQQLKSLQSSKSLYDSDEPSPNRLISADKKINN
ncbi:KilA-N domain-containing protein [Pedobacter fastidiosus]|uniref:KilA-N domain-containing protein n=1 Tax=Pedobacter fastidiosus TaxID=2765361 RepID=UPI0021CFB66E|nr:KilA-N domain-containing protein [Pedobacter fastidiosus]